MSLQNRFQTFFLLLLFVWAPSVTASTSIWVEYYSPQFYVDKLVFFDDVGTPYYYEDDQAYAIPQDFPEYQTLVDHYMENVDGYLRWFDEVGHQNLEYRRLPKVEYYEPEYYQEYPIFFTSEGRPYYYVDGLEIQVKVTDPLYNNYLRHFQRHQAAYVRWHRERGRHYRWYRRPLFTDYYRPIFYDGYVVNFDPVGLPFIYRAGLQIYIDHKHHRYDYYVKHHKRYRDKYRRWYHERGRKHHHYRLPKVYRRYKLKKNVTRAMHGRAIDRAEHRRTRNMKILKEWRIKRHDSRLERKKDRFDKRMEKREKRFDKRMERKKDRFDKRMDRRVKRHERREDRRERHKDRKEKRVERRKKYRQ